ncbi:MAG: hypothetical protein GY906_10320 [bacterium]|nr:hypothetical protein [bacterium]
MSIAVEVRFLPPCDFCKEDARYDGKTRTGPWAYMCPTHWRAHGMKLGTGWGQKLISRAEIDLKERTDDQ